MTTKKPRLAHLPLIPHPNPPTLIHGRYTSQQLRDLIAEKEFCIIKNVLSSDDVIARRDGLKKAFASIYDAKTNASLGFDLDRPSTLVNTPPYKTSGTVAVEHTAGLNELVALRLDPNVSSVYENYYGCTASELATSNDRFNVMLPNNTNCGLAPHIDANPKLENQILVEDVLQGFVVLQNSINNTQGFVIYPGHAKNPGKWAKPDCDSDFYLLDDDQKEQLGQGYIISPPAGSMVVWLSSAVHANTNGKGKKLVVGRMVAYIAKYPWSRISIPARQTLEDAFKNKVTLGHNVIRPSVQKTGCLRFGPPIDWQFAREHLTNYETKEQIPEILRAPN